MFLSRVQENIIKMRWTPWMLAFLSAALLRLSFPRPGIWLLAWVALVPLFFSLERKDTAQVFVMSFAAGYVYNVALLFWLIHVTVAGMLVLCAYLALYPAVFGLAWAYSRRYFSFGARLIFAPSVWIVLEFVRAHLLTGFPWAFLSYTQTPDIIALQGADLFGSWGLSFILVFVNVFIFEGLSAPGGLALRSGRFLVPFAVVAAWFSYGFWRISQPVVQDDLTKVAVVQGNIPQEIKWVERFSEGIFRKHALLSELTVLKENPDLIIWPETSFADYLEAGVNDRELSDLAVRLNVPLVVGAVRFEDLHYYNSALLYDAQGRLATVYDKIHLVPFGEYLPGRRYLHFLENVIPIEDFTRGDDFHIFCVPSAAGCGLRFGILICFEDIFPELSRAFVARGADFLVNMTNDGWFGDTSSPFQHAQASVLRAVENRVYVVRAANTGISCIIDDAGRFVAGVADENGKETYVRGEAAAVIGATRRTSLYTRVGDALIPIVSFLIFGMIVWRRRRS
jgi:apolipoprotein N-acyltransferase